MFSKLALFAAASMAVLVSAGNIENSCNTGDIQCCETLYQSSSQEANFLANLVGVVANSVTAQVGVHCSPITAIGVAGNSCSQQPVCCTGNNYNGLINVGCTPVNANV